jgi:hypothetical protein
MDLNRPPKSAREIGELQRLDDAAIGRLLRDRGTELSPETLVYLLRGTCGCDSRLFDLCGRLLIGRPRPDGRFDAGHCERLIVSMAFHFGFGELDDLNEFRARCHFQMWNAIQAGTEKKHYWEERFYLALSDACFDIGRQMIREREHRVAFSDDEEHGAPEYQTDIGAEDDILAGIDAEAIREAIRQLPFRLRQAAWLRWIVGLQVESRDPEEPTITKVMKVTDRMVRYYLDEAAERLRENPILKALLSDYGLR